MEPAGLSLLIILAYDVGLQVLMFGVSWALRTEKFFDLTGAFTYFTAVLIALFARPEGGVISALDARQGLVAAFTMVWSLRLGIFLFARVMRTGKDSRFDTIKNNFWVFFGLWIGQSVWIFLTALPVFIVISNPAGTAPGITWDAIGIILWVFGFSIEIIADQQKTNWKKTNPHDFIHTGLWSWSRHPNYFGELTLWVGMSILCSAGYVAGWQYIGWVSPVFVFWVLCYGTGIPMLEKQADERYGSQEAYQVYKKSTSIFVLWPPSKPKVGSLEGGATATASPAQEPAAGSPKAP